VIPRNSKGITAMAAMSDYLENKLIDFLFRGVAAPTLPSTLYVALFTANPTDAVGGTEVSTSGTNYARATIARAADATGWAATNAAGSTAASSTGTGGTTSNNAAITFNAPGGSPWGSITGFGIFDAATNGNLLWWGALGTAKTVNANDAAPSFAIGQLQIQLDT
jgi:hypothetical protein